MKQRLKAEVSGPGDFERTAVRVSYFSIIGNAILVIFVFVIPGLILLTSIVLWIRRRNK